MLMSLIYFKNSTFPSLKMVFDSLISGIKRLNIITESPTTEDTNILCH